MLFKDRYSFTIALSLVLIFLSVYLMQINYEKLSIISITTGCFAFIYLMSRPGKLHISSNLSDNSLFNGVDDCKFSDKSTNKVDDLKINGKRFRVVSGADVYINESGEIKNCGPGSSLMQIVFKGGFDRHPG